MIDHILWITLVCFAFYFKSLCYKYVSDDIPSSQRPHSKPAWKHWLFVLEGRERSGRPQIDRFISLCVHTLTCMGLYLGFGANQTSFFAAMLFAVNPANNQVSVWISGRAYGYVAMGSVWMLAVPALAPALMLLTTYFPSGFVFPAIFATSAHPLIALCLPLAWVFHMKRFKRNVADKISKEMFAEDRKIHFGKVVLFVKTLGFYLAHGAIPWKTTFYHSYLQSAAGSMKHKAFTIKDRFFWIGLVGLTGMGWFWASHPWGLPSFAMLWWLVGIAPFGNFMRIHQEIAERYMYLPNIGLMFLVATLLTPMAFAVLFTLYATRMWFYMDSYQDDYYLVEHACLNSPDAWFALHVRGLKRWEGQSHNEALIFWMMAKAISPNEYKVNFNIASALALSSNPEHRKKAPEFMKIAMDNVPGGQEEQARKLYDDWNNNKKAILL